jgi:hypothetical protein
MNRGDLSLPCSFWGRQVKRGIFSYLLTILVIDLLILVGVIFPFSKIRFLPTLQRSKKDACVGKKIIAR